MTTDRMMLRTVFLSLELDNTLRDLAFTNHQTKEDLLLCLVNRGLELEEENRLRFVSEKTKSKRAEKIKVQTAKKTKTLTQ